MRVVDHHDLRLQASCLPSLVSEPHHEIWASTVLSPLVACDLSVIVRSPFSPANTAIGSCTIIITSVLFNSIDTLFVQVRKMTRSFVTIVINTSCKALLLRASAKATNVKVDKIQMLSFIIYAIMGTNIAIICETCEKDCEYFGYDAESCGLKRLLRI